MTTETDQGAASKHGPPKLDPQAMTKWDIFFRGYLEGRHNAQRALDEDYPVRDKEKFASLLVNGQETAESVLYLKRLRTRKLVWKKRNGIAKAAIMEACMSNPTAVIVIMENRQGTARNLYEKILKRFELRQTSAIQAKLAEFNGLVINGDYHA